MVFFAAVLWGVYWIPLRYLTGLGITGPWAVAAINLPAALIGLVMYWRNRTHERQHLGQALWIGMFAGMGLAFYGLSLEYTSVVRATLFFYLMPIWGTFIGIFFLGEGWSWQRWAAIAMGLLGLVFLLGGNQDTPFGGGDILAFASGWAWTISGALIKRAGPVPMGGMLSIQFICVAIFAFGAGAFFEPLTLPQFQGAAVWVISAAIAIFGVFPAVALVFWGSQFLFPGRVGLLLMAEVFVAVLTASIFLPDEILAPIQWLAVVLIISAGFVELIPSRRSS